MVFLDPHAAAAAAKSLQSCLTLCDPIDSSPPGSPVPGILQARTLEWVAISFSNAWMWKVKGKSLSHVRLFVTPCTAAHQAPPSMGFSRQEYWNGEPLPSLLVTLPGIKSTPPALEGTGLTHRTTREVPQLWFYRTEVQGKEFSPKATMKGPEWLMRPMRLKLPGSSLSLASLSTRNLLWVSQVVKGSQVTAESISWKLFW